MTDHVIKPIRLWSAPSSYTTVTRAAGRSLMVIKAVIFDIGGVVVRSPMLAIAKYEKEHGIPPNYINCIMCAYNLSLLSS